MYLAEFNKRIEFIEIEKQNSMAIANLGYPYYTCGNDENEKTLSYEIELVNKTVKFLKDKGILIIRKTYRITQVISKCGVVQKITKLIGILGFVLGLRFQELKQVEPTIQRQTQVERQLEHLNLDQAMEGSKSRSVRNLFKISRKT